ncbi:hypothetical protein J4436_02700 [Candidatus Woesearchaeota archaeon]|nr:hypothetical protein [Candidatus Woesearchaeota archaeon]
MQEKILDTLLEKAVIEVNIVSLVRLDWSTVYSGGTIGTDDVKGTINYEGLIEFLEKYRHSHEMGIPFLTSLPDIKRIESIIDYAIDCGVGSGYMGRDDFHVCETEYIQRKELKELISKLKL